MNLNLLNRHGGVVGVSLLDDDAPAVLASHVWRLHPDGYAVRYERRDGRLVAIFLHQEVVGARTTTHTHVDHLNGDRLDNRRTNLSVGSRGDNMRNRRAFAGSTSKFSGVHLDKGKWRACVKVDGKRHYLGTFESEDEAGAAVAELRAEIKARTCRVLYEVDIDGEPLAEAVTA